MEHRKVLEAYPELFELWKDLKNLFHRIDNAYLERFNRSLPISELLNDRWERAARLGFGSESSIYDSSLVFGTPLVGSNCWIGPFTVIDGSGGLCIGNSCTISAGVQIYSHDNIKATLNPDLFEIERSNVAIGNNCYIAPNSIIAKGVQLGDFCIVAANSLVNKSFASNSIVGGNPAKLLGHVEFIGNSVVFNYEKLS